MLQVKLFSPAVRTCSPDLKTYFTKISVSGEGGRVISFFVFISYLLPLDVSYVLKDADNYNK